MPPRIAIAQCKLSPPPSRLFRVTDWHEPFSPPDPPTPLGATDHDDEYGPAGRWDDPAGKFRTLYCASQAECAVGEKLAHFTLNPAAAARVDAYPDEDPDPEFAEEQLLRPVDGDDIASMNWNLSWAPADTTVGYIDVDHWRTFAAARGVGHILVREFGLRAFDRSTILDNRRSVTRRFAGYLHEAAVAYDPISTRGIRYSTRLPPPWTCWAMWEPVGVDASRVESEALTINSPAVRRAARKLSVLLATR
jgi:hypothetical protein